MICSRHLRLLALGVSLALTANVGPVGVSLAAVQVQKSAQPTPVTLRWGARAGVSRYRLQLANDATFTDVVFDRVVSGQEYRLSDLAPGRYYWRVASLNAKRGEFSSAGVVHVPAISPTKAPSEVPVSVSPDTPANLVSPRGAWYAAIGNVAKTIVAHGRAPANSEIIAVTTDGRIVALDAVQGVALWIVRVETPASDANFMLLTVRARDGADNVLVIAGSVATLIEVRTGRKLWRAILPANAAVAVVDGPKVFVIDNSFRKLLVVDANSGTAVSATALPRRAVGAPVIVSYRGAPVVMVALDDGELQIFDRTGKSVLAASAGSPATTAPLVVRTARGDLILIGTQSGLTALTADELTPLGQVTFKNDSPRGALLSRDLDGDGRAEVIVFTARGRVVVVKSDEGKIVWEADARRAESAAFADVNGDRVLDLFIVGREGLALALSGRDGSIVWKDQTALTVATNHAPAATPREATSVPSASGVLVVAADQNRTGLRAIEFPKR